MPRATCKHQLAGVRGCPREVPPLATQPLYSPCTCEPVKLLLSSVSCTRCGASWAYSWGRLPSRRLLAKRSHLAGQVAGGWMLARAVKSAPAAAALLLSSLPARHSHCGNLKHHNHIKAMWPTSTIPGVCAALEACHAAKLGWQGASQVVVLHLQRIRWSRGGAGSGSSGCGWMQIPCAVVVASRAQGVQVPHLRTQL